ncbi:hypothetical protein [Streptomyces synnematoformans]
MADSPEDHFGALGDDLSRVLHLGWNAGAKYQGRDDPRQTVGFDVDLCAYSLTDGRPGRPFLRVSDEADGANNFEVHDVASAAYLLQQMAGAVRNLAGFLEMLSARQEAEEAQWQAVRLDGDLRQAEQQRARAEAGLRQAQEYIAALEREMAAAGAARDAAHWQVEQARERVADAERTARESRRVAEAAAARSARLEGAR